MAPAPGAKEGAGGAELATTRAGGTLHVDCDRVIRVFDHLAEVLVMKPIVRCGHGKSRAQTFFVYHCEFIDAGVNQKAFEAAYTSGSQGSNVFEIFGNQPCPCRPIHAALA